MEDPFGLAIILVVGRTRTGAMQDIQHCTEIARHLRCRTFTFSDIHGQPMNVALVKALFARAAPAMARAAFGVVMAASHGSEKGAIEIGFGSAETTINVDFITKFMDQTLGDKLKLVLINKCRGSRMAPLLGQEPVADAPDAARSSRSGLRHVVVGANRFLAYSTAEGTVSYRDADAGSVWFRLLAESFRDHGRRNSLPEVVGIAGTKLAAEIARIRSKTPQAPVQEHNLLLPYLVQPAVMFEVPLAFCPFVTSCPDTIKGRQCPRHASCCVPLVVACGNLITDPATTNIDVECMGPVFVYETGDLHCAKCHATATAADWQLQCHPRSIGCTRELRASLPKFSEKMRVSARPCNALLMSWSHAVSHPSARPGGGTAVLPQDVASAATRNCLFVAP